MVLVHLGFGVGGGLAGVGVVDEFEDAAPDVRPVGEGDLVALDFDSFLFDVHAEHAPVGLIWHNRSLLRKLLPLFRQGREHEETIFR